ncbi:Polyketide cyclase / dehydrase and lipid transport [Mycobacteroides abscessus subsp. bolletii]|uniref:SRPBCC family protein n=1 Tax=Mycobacteroides abscessus TaxID=36809 RepID=UPI0009A8788A|nr:SRPBCC family protein [Mycobacteroides abscessus]SLC21635.1 Polyketide cyclase / dehydrase and lipid transport [Mycobacteroides abscessus subsp. bolletii]
METWLIIVIAVACLAAVGAVLGVILLVILAAGGISAARFSLTPVGADQLRGYLDSEASFAITVQRDFFHPPDQVFKALLDERFMSWAPFTKGVDYAGTALRDIGTKRALVNTFIVLAEQIVVNEPGRVLGVTATACSVPLVLDSVAEVFDVVDNGTGGTRLTWHVGGTPRWVGWLPLLMAAPFVRPVAAWQLGKLRPIIGRR